jgi:hypothetical protein
MSRGLALPKFAESGNFSLNKLDVGVAVKMDHQTEAG